MIEALLDVATQFAWLVAFFTLARGLQALGELTRTRRHTRTHKTQQHDQ